MMTKTMRQWKLVAPGKMVAETVPIPVPGDDEVLLKVCRIGICGSDLTIYRGHHPYAISPLVMGHEFAGEIVAVGKNANRKVGEKVAAIPHLVCGHCQPCRSKTFNFCEELRCMGAEAHGAHAEYICIPAEMAIPVPAGFNLDMAAMLEPACVALHGVRREPIPPGGKVLVVGVGPIGLFAVQSAKALGAKEVYAADLDERRLELAKRLGAHGVVCLKNTDLVKGLKECGCPAKDIDVFVDCVGLKGQALDVILANARRGASVVMIGVLQNGYVLPHLPDFVQHELRLSGSTMYTPKDYRDMIALMHEKKVRIDGLISHRIRFSELPETLARIDRGKLPHFKIMVDVVDVGSSEQKKP